MTQEFEDLGSLQLTEQELSALAGQASWRFKEVPVLCCWHCKSLEVQIPEAQDKSSEPQEVPSDSVSSAGQSAVVPEQVSAWSHRGSWLALQTNPEDWSWHWSVQHPWVEGSQTDPEVRVHSVEQHWDPLGPASHSSPGSLIPFPHCCSLRVVLPPGTSTQVVSDSPLPSIEQMFPIVHWEKESVLCSETGFMMNWELEEQVLALKGQQVAPPSRALWVATLPDELQSSAQSWMAPKLSK